MLKCKTSAVQWEVSHFAHEQYTLTCFGVSRDPSIFLKLLESEGRHKSWLIRKLGPVLQGLPFSLFLSKVALPDSERPAVHSAD